MTYIQPHTEPMCTECKKNKGERKKQSICVGCTVYSVHRKTKLKKWKRQYTECHCHQFQNVSRLWKDRYIHTSSHNDADCIIFTFNAKTFTIRQCDLTEEYPMILVDIHLAVFYEINK